MQQQLIKIIPSTTTDVSVEITIPGIIIQLFPYLFYLMYKEKNNLEETIIQCIYLDWKYAASVIFNWQYLVVPPPMALLETGVINWDWPM